MTYISKHVTIASNRLNEGELFFVAVTLDAFSALLSVVTSTALVTLVQRL